jgi:hypothetical protein
MRSARQAKRPLLIELLESAVDVAAGQEKKNRRVLMQAAGNLSRRRKTGSSVCPPGVAVSRGCRGSH